MQLIFFGYGVGALLAPQIAKPFLTPVRSNRRTSFTAYNSELLEEKRSPDQVLLTWADGTVSHASVQHMSG
jgi:hypothetical protein